ncbi:bifunctional 2-polyprenyl-6-hydroxyphenol methylase/3-demethylubiquinol 3-O-methyltransferase UbiG [Rhodanobacter sp. FW104-R8]|nr:class I SAM-dependent methyltransferase [Rhodanobacter sp. FW104-R8]
MTDPRWGQDGRDRKAEAILATLKEHCRRDLTLGVWLDVGCGSGGVAATLAAHVEQVIGVDPEPWIRWQALCDERPNLAFHAGSYRDLTNLLASESIDVVVCNQVYEHVDDPAALLQAIRRVMKPGGVCYFAGPNLLWPIEPHVFWPFVHWLPRRFAQHWMRRLGSRQADDLDAWSRSYWGLTRLFRRVGYQYTGAIHARLRAGAGVAGAARFLRMSAHVPRGFVTALTPISPGFVFILTKPPE